MAQTPSLLNRSPASPADYHTPRRAPLARSGALRHAGPRPRPGSVRLGGHPTRIATDLTHRPGYEAPDRSIRYSAFSAPAPKAPAGGDFGDVDTTWPGTASSPSPPPPQPQGVSYRTRPPLAHPQTAHGVCIPSGTTKSNANTWADHSTTPTPPSCRRTCWVRAPSAAHYRAHATRLVPALP